MQNSLCLSCCVSVHLVRKEFVILIDWQCVGVAHDGLVYRDI